MTENQTEGNTKVRMLCIPVGSLPLAARERAPTHGAGDLKKNASHLLGATEMKFRIIEDQRETFPVRVLCDVMGVSPAGYYAWRGRPESPRKAANCALLGNYPLPFFRAQSLRNYPQF